MDNAVVCIVSLVDLSLPLCLGYVMSIYFRQTQHITHKKKDINHIWFDQKPQTRVEKTFLSAHQSSARQEKHAPRGKRYRTLFFFPLFFSRLVLVDFCCVYFLSFALFGLSLC